MGHSRVGLTPSAAARPAAHPFYLIVFETRGSLILCVAKVQEPSDRDSDLDLPLHVVTKSSTLSSLLCFLFLCLKVRFWEVCFLISSWLRAWDSDLSPGGLWQFLLHKIHPYARNMPKSDCPMSRSTNSNGKFGLNWICPENSDPELFVWAYFRWIVFSGNRHYDLFRWDTGLYRELHFQWKLSQETASFWRFFRGDHFQSDTVLGSCGGYGGECVHGDEGMNANQILEFGSLRNNHFWGAK